MTASPPFVWTIKCPGAWIPRINTFSSGKGLADLANPFPPVYRRFSFFTAFGFLLLVIRCRPGLMGIQDPPKFIKTGEGFLFLLPSGFDNAYHFVRDTFTSSVDAKNVGFHIAPPAFGTKLLLPPL
jgi:hypothetical protein